MEGLWIADLVGLGAGGHAKVLVDAIRARGTHDVVALLDADPDLHGREVAGVPVEGDDERLPELREAGIEKGFVGIGSIGRADTRVDLFARLVDHDFEPVTVVHPAATVSPSAELASGPIVLANAVVNADTIVQDNVIVNTGSVIEHDCRLRDHAHVAPGAVLGGTVDVGERAHVGLGASVSEAVTIGKDAVLGAGAVVVDDVEPRTTVAGVPAEPLE